MINFLTVQDPLNDKTVIINIQIKPDSKKRDQRTALVTVGVSGQVPIMLNGPFGQLNQLIDKAWRSFGEKDIANTTITEVQAPKQAEQPKNKKESILSLF